MLIGRESGSLKTSIARRVSFKAKRFPGEPPSNTHSPDLAIRTDCPWAANEWPFRTYGTMRTEGAKSHVNGPKAQQFK